jgi:hypothetical protein
MGTAFWTTAIAMLGGAIMALALLFPKEIKSIQRHSSMRIFTYLISIGLVIWGWSALYASSDPWAYVVPWRMSFFYTGFSLVFPWDAVISFTKPSFTIERQQIRCSLAA